MLEHMDSRMTTDNATLRSWMTGGDAIAQVENSGNYTLAWTIIILEGLIRQVATERRGLVDRFASIQEQLEALVSWGEREVTGLNDPADGDGDAMSESASMLDGDYQDTNVPDHGHAHLAMA
ncbi:hypothetical protein O9K51_07597 [Purpureocillium lavendulum]|uniref:Uncharacterized protein n=1 Tax=Purpureocillium lavendulum TaxID=1247861 RepID=A0AB34FMV8_9HYPO|nr:hypothetical protein O9K51_07597 [Purpureocillium lavendulum]